MTKQSFPLTEKFITERIHHLCPGSDVNPRHAPDVDIWLFEVNISSQTVRVKFSEERMEDFEEVLRRPDDRSPYAIRFKYYFEFQIHIDLGMGGIIPRLRVSELFLREQHERKDWWKDARVKVELDPKMAGAFYQGLKKLDIFLSGALKRLGDMSKELKQTDDDRQRLKSIIDYYDSNDESLNEDSASLKSLSLLKASALAEIVEQEIQRSKSDLPEATRVFNRKIYVMTKLLRGSFFLEVPMPEWINSYVKAAFNE